MAEKFLDEDADRAFLRIVVWRSNGKMLDRIYALLPVEQGGTLLGWRLQYANATHDIELTPFGPRCDCPDWDWRTGSTGVACKHEIGRAHV